MFNVAFVQRELVTQLNVTGELVTQRNVTGVEAAAKELDEAVQYSKSTSLSCCLNLFRCCALFPSMIKSCMRCSSRSHAAWPLVDRTALEVGQDGQYHYPR